MGELLYKCAEKVLDNKQPTSIYAPIGKYKDLLPYLVRRLLENGANSSFINRLLDPETDAAWLASGPHKKIENERKDIPLPCNIFTNRKNSKGLDISEMDNLDTIKTEISKFKNQSVNAISIYRNRADDESRKHDVFSLADGARIGSVCYDNTSLIKKSLEAKTDLSWPKVDVQQRAQILQAISNDLESNPYQLIYYLMHEAGKTIQNSIDEIREAIDFLRYYSNQMIGIEEKDGKLDGPTGEENILTYGPKGHIVCISPWNFPVAILIGQISAALITGNKVTLKPSEHTSILGFLVVNIFHKNGVPVDALE